MASGLVPNTSIIFFISVYPFRGQRPLEIARLFLTSAYLNKAKRRDLLIANFYMASQGQRPLEYARLF